MRILFPRIYVKVREIRINPFPSSNLGIYIYIYIYEKKGYERKNSLKPVSLVLKKIFFFLNSLWFIVGLKFHHNGLNLLSTVDNMVKTYI